MNLNVKIPRKDKPEFLKDFLEILPRLIKIKENELNQRIYTHLISSSEAPRETEKFERNRKEALSEKVLAKHLRWASTLDEFFKLIDGILSYELKLKFHPITENILKTAFGYKYALKFGAAKNIEDYVLSSNTGYEFAQDEKLFNELLEKKLMSKEDLQTLLKVITDNSLLYHPFFRNTSFVQYALNNMLFDQEIVDNFNAFIKESRGKYVESNIENVFDELRDSVESLQNEELYKKIDLNESLYLLSHFNLSNEDQFEIAQQIVDNDQAQKRLKEIVENKLEYMFDDATTLLKHLKKTQKKYTLAI